MNNNEENFQDWCENNGVTHLGDYLYEYKDGEYTLNQLRSIYQLEKSIQPAPGFDHDGDCLDDELDAEDVAVAQTQHMTPELYFPAGFFED